MIRHVASATMVGAARRPGPLGTAFALAFLLSAPAVAIVYVMPTDESMVDRASVIVFGEVRSASPALDRRRPVTDYLLDVEEVLKGTVAAGTIAVRQPGGVDDDGTAMWMMGLPMLAEGDRVLLFLRPEAEGAHRIVEYALGMFWEVRAGDRPLLLREPSLEGEAPTSPDALTPAPAGNRQSRDADGFRQWIAERATGLERPRDYFVADLPRSPEAVASPYRLLRLPEGQEGCHADNEGLPLRWQEFDRGEILGLVVHSGGQPGVPGGGLQQVRTGMTVWNDDARSRVDLAVLRTTDELLTSSERDDVLSIMYEDPHDEVDGRFGDGGEKGGVLAVALAVAAYCEPHRIPHRAEDAVSLSEVNIVTQDGLGDHLRSGDVVNPANYFERIIAHELGHAIGISHPCEIEEADCDDSHPHRGALMYPTTGASDTSRARLHPDDQAAVRHLYSAQVGEPPPPTSGCRPTTTALQFDGGYTVSMCYRTPQGEEDQAKSGIWASGQSGLLWFFNRENAEVLVKVLDGCSHNGHRWTFVAPVTTLEFNLWITGPNGQRWTHSNTQGRTAATRSDTSAFRCADEPAGR